MLFPPINALPPAPLLTAIVGATVIDGTGAAPIADAVVVFRDKRIVAVGRRGSLDIPPEARQVAATGKWLIPGLIDMHVHLDEDISPGAFVLFGVTSVRDVGSRLITLQKLRARAAKGETLPTFYWMGRNIDEGKPSWWGAVAVKGPNQVPALLRDMAKQGVDGVKLYVRAGPKVTQAVIREAHRRGWPVTAHLEDTRPGQAAQMGLDSLEHVATLFLELTPKTIKKKPGYGGRFPADARVDLYGQKTQRLLALLKKHRVAITPTLAVVTLPVEGEKAAEALYRGWADIPAGWRAFWKTKYWDFITPKGWTARDYRLARQAREKYIKMVRRLDRAGVPLVAGTDTPAPWVLPGAGLLLELEWMVKAGVSPARALTAATGRAAEVLRKADNVGTIRVGRFADFVLLDADPLKDIRNLRRIDSVYVRGRLVDRAALQKRFQQAKPPP
jgi:imidazolonepropionase-like amidohydrolase